MLKKKLWQEVLRSFYSQSPPTILRRWLYPSCRLQEDDVRKKYDVGLCPHLFLVSKEGVIQLWKGSKETTNQSTVDVLLSDSILYELASEYFIHFKKKCKHTWPPEQRLSKCWAWQIIQTASLLLLGSPCIPEIPYLICAFS